jgi:hypothetical protein
MRRRYCDNSRNQKGMDILKDYCELIVNINEAKVIFRKDGELCTLKVFSNATLF